MLPLRPFLKILKFVSGTVQDGGARVRSSDAMLEQSNTPLLNATGNDQIP